MRSNYPLFQSHLDLAYSYWKSIVNVGDIIIDATCGNGKDTLKLAELSIRASAGHLYAYDIQSQAITTTQNYLTNHLSSEQMLRITFVCASHSTFSDKILPSSVKLITYNLGYLPGGDKNLTTHTHTTIASLESAIPLIASGGVISITCYPGHPAGMEEEKNILTFTASLNPKEWSVCHHRWMNRNAAPSLLLLQKCSNADELSQRM